MSVAPPIVIDLGKTRLEHVRQLPTGAGRLADDIQEVMRLVRLNANSESGNRVFLPVVVVYG